MTPQSAGVALIRLAAVALAGVGMGLVLATFGTGASSADEEAGLATVQVAVLFFGPIAALLTLAFIVVLALTRPASMAMPSRRRAARGVCVAYLVAGLLAGVALMSLAWALIGSLVTAGCSGGAWWMLREQPPRGRSGA
ncbi:MAG: hypothetical protein ACKOFP_01715 [Actinomycetota bacterium]